LCAVSCWKSLQSISLQFLSSKPFTSATGFNRIFLPWTNDMGKTESEYANYCYKHAREVPGSYRSKSNG
jgi:hypothetical protein